MKAQNNAHARAQHMVQIRSSHTNSHSMQAYRPPRLSLKGQAQMCVRAGALSNRGCEAEDGVESFSSPTQPGVLVVH